MCFTLITCSSTNFGHEISPKTRGTLKSNNAIKNGNNRSSDDNAMFLAPDLLRYPQFISNATFFVVEDWDPQNIDFD